MYISKLKTRWGENDKALEIKRKCKARMVE